MTPHDVKLLIGVKRVLKVAAGSKGSVVVNLRFERRVVIVAQDVDEIQISATRQVVGSVAQFRGSCN